MAIRDLFPGYFRLQSSEFDGIWKRALIVPDTNIMLHVLRYGPETRRQVLDALTAFKDRLWVPYRVALEFSKHWRDVEIENRTAYDKVKNEVRGKGNALGAVFDRVTRHQIIDADAEKKKITVFIDSLVDSLDEAAKRHPSIEDVETIIEQVSKIVGTAIGQEPTADTLAKWAMEAARRYERGIPPGYSDRKKEGDEKYSDFFIWEEMINAATTRSMPVIFVSDDRKDDWVLERDGHDLGPRPELIQEFWQRTGQRFYSYSLSEFLKWAQEYTKVTVSEKAIAEVEEESQKARQEEAKRELEQLAADLSTQVAAGTAPSTVTSSATPVTYPIITADGLLHFEPRSLSIMLEEQDALRRSFGTPDAYESLRKQQEAFNRAFPPNAIEQFRKQQEALKKTFPPNAIEMFRKQQEALRQAFPPNAIEQFRKQQEAWKEIFRPSAIEEFRRQQEAWKDIFSPSAIEEFLKHQEALKQVFSRNAFDALTIEEQSGQGATSSIADDDCRRHERTDQANFDSKEASPAASETTDPPEVPKVESINEEPDKKS